MRILVITILVAAAAIAVNGFIETPFRKAVIRHLQAKAAPEAVTPSTVVLNSITQRVDNFNTQNHDTWTQRFYMNGEFFQPGGPVFVFIGGEWNITEYRLTQSLMADLAEELFGYIFYLEHRFYGESFPTEDLSDDNLRFLTAEQAMADVAHFIAHIQRLDVIPGTQESAVVVIGAHYSASLAAWFRAQYPHLVVAAWASSAPVLSEINQVDYKEIAGAVFRQVGGNACYDRLESGFNEMEEMVQDGEFEELSTLFNLCDVIHDDENDISVFFAIIAELYSIMAQFSQIVPIAEVCEQLLDDTQESHAANVALILGTLLSELYDGCLPIDYDYIVESDRETEIGAISIQSGFRQFSYQTCTQFGWHHSSDSDHQPFGDRFPIAFFRQACEDVFGDLADLIDANSASVNLRFGALQPEVENVIYTHGMHDPWRTMGIQEDLNPLAPAFVIPGASQGNDLGPITEDDSVDLLRVKLEIKDILRQWIAASDGIDVVPI